MLVPCWVRVSRWGLRRPGAPPRTGAPPGEGAACSGWQGGEGERWSGRGLTLDETSDGFQTARGAATTSTSALTSSGGAREDVKRVEPLERPGRSEIAPREAPEVAGRTRPECRVTRERSTTTNLKSGHRLGETVCAKRAWKTPHRRGGAAPATRRPKVAGLRPASPPATEPQRRRPWLDRLDLATSLLANALAIWAATADRVQFARVAAGVAAVFGLFALLRYGFGDKRRYAVSAIVLLVIALGTLGSSFIPDQPDVVGTTPYSSFASTNQRDKELGASTAMRESAQGPPQEYTSKEPLGSGFPAGQNFPNTHAIYDHFCTGGGDTRPCGGVIRSHFYSRDPNADPYPGATDKQKKFTREATFIDTQPDGSCQSGQVLISRIEFAFPDGRKIYDVSGGEAPIGWTRAEPLGCVTKPS